MILLSLCTENCAGADPFHAVQCDGAYPKHLQGICTNDLDAIYWSFTTVLVKTDSNGRILQKVSVADHHGDLCYHDGKVFVAVNLGQFNLPAGRADSWIYVYDGNSLVEMARHKVPELVHGAGGIAFQGGRFFVVGGLPAGIEENYVYEYDASFAFQQRHVVATGYTLMGIQTIAYIDDCWWFGCYGNPRVLVKADKQFKVLGKWNIDCSLGIAAVSTGQILIARGAVEKNKGYSARLVLAIADDEKGLRFIDDAPPKQQ
jgi:hypothetical protein